jgi:mono/diheme cytochrome c family protein
LTKELLEKPLTATSPEPTVQRTVITLLAVLLLVVLAFVGIHHFRHADPYVRDVLSHAGDAQRGEVMFQMNCASCHGFDASGWVGPNLHRVASRKSRIGLIHQVTSGSTPPMPQFQPSPQEMADLLEYLESL